MHFLSFTLFSSDAKADKMAATKGSTHSFIGFWTAIDTMDGSTLRLSISCDDAGEFVNRIHNVA